MNEPDKYTFGIEPQIDGSTPILKNGQKTACPKAPLIAYENPRIQGQIITERFACNSNCPFLMSAERKYKDSDKIESGFIVNCMDKPIFLMIEKPVNNPKLKLLN